MYVPWKRRVSDATHESAQKIGRIYKAKNDDPSRYPVEFSYEKKTVDKCVHVVATKLAFNVSVVCAVDWNSSRSGLSEGSIWSAWLDHWGQFTNSLLTSAANNTHLVKLLTVHRRLYREVHSLHGTKEDQVKGRTSGKAETEALLPLWAANVGHQLRISTSDKPAFQTQSSLPIYSSTRSTDIH